MLQPLLFAAVILAQAMPPPSPRVPMPGAVGTSPADGISVMGTRTAQAQATDAQVTLRVISRNT